jgi:hypothetical protein
MDIGAPGPAGCCEGAAVGAGLCPTGLLLGRGLTCTCGRSGPDEGCGPLCTGPEAASSCGTRTTGAPWMRSGPRAKGEAGPMPKTTTAPKSTAAAAVAETGSLKSPLDV